MIVKVHYFSEVNWFFLSDIHSLFLSKLVAAWGSILTLLVSAFHLPKISLYANFSLFFLATNQKNPNNHYSCLLKSLGCFWVCLSPSPSFSKVKKSYVAQLSHWSYHHSESYLFLFFCSTQRIFCNYRLTSLKFALLPSIFSSTKLSLGSLQCLFQPILFIVALSLFLAASLLLSNHSFLWNRIWFFSRSHQT